MKGTPLVEFEKALFESFCLCPVENDIKTKINEEIKYGKSRETKIRQAGTNNLSEE